MTVLRWRHSLKWRIVASYSLILILGGVSTAVIGIRVFNHALLQQAQHQMDAGLSHARTIYTNHLNELRQCVEVLATSRRVRTALTSNEPAAARDFVRSVQQARRLDFLSIADSAGRVGFRTTGAGVTGDTVADLAPIAQALSGEPAASTELLPRARLQREDPALAARLDIELVETATTGSQARKRLDAGLVLLAAAPVKDEAGQVVAVLYTGELLNEADTSPDSVEAHEIVDEVKDELFPGLQFQGRAVGAATIFQDDIRITTNVMTAEGRRALGTRVSREVYQAVMNQGKTWHDRAFVVNEWYISAYEPITNLAGERIGILFVGLLQRPYSAVRDNVMLAFAAITLFCFVLIIVVTYFLTRSLVRPLENMVAVSKEIAAGDLSHRVDVTDQGELGLLSSSLNTMLDRIHDMKTQLEQWAKMLEQKVAERTEQLTKTQAAMDRQQRLASLGQLAAGVAHEINNPLGGVLTFASLLREELPPDSPMRADVEEIVHQADRCRKIVQELLEFSREREARMAPHSINEIVARTLAMLEKQASFQNVNIVREIDPDAPVAVVDESQLQQVFINIILNAADSMNERGTLTVETGHDRDNKEVFVRISDTGCGIPEEIREAIFDPFFSTKEPGKGTGLGLAVACRIVQAHGGHLEVDSEVGRGSTFTVVLPLTTRPADDSATPGATESSWHRV